MFFISGMKRALSKLNTSHVSIVFHWLCHPNCKDPSISLRPRPGVGDELDRSRDGKSTLAQLKAAHFHFNNACIDARQTDAFDQIPRLKSVQWTPAFVACERCQWVSFHPSSSVCCISYAYVRGGVGKEGLDSRTLFALTLKGGVLILYHLPLA